jgi:predicted nucleic acid-binding protein
VEETAQRVARDQQPRSGRDSDPARQAGGRFAVDRADNIYASDVLEIVHSTREDELEAVRLLRKYSDQQVSFTDCTSFVLMKSRQISSVFTFDLHFQRAGFHIVGAVDS